MQIFFQNMPVCAMWFVTLRSLIYFSPIALQDIQDEYYTALVKYKIPPRTTLKEQFCTSRFLKISNRLAGYILATKEDGLRNRDKIALMLENVRLSLGGIINKTSWLDEQSKVEAIKKVNHISSYISFSDKHLDLRAIENYYSRMAVGSNYYVTSVNISQNMRTDALRNILSQNHFDDRNTVGVNPTSVIAVYYQNYVHLALSSGMIGYPFFDHGLDVLNYASMGSQIGHEMGHAFDNIGIQFRWNGEMRPLLLSAASNVEYRKKEKCFRDSYRRFFYRSIQKQVNGDSTLPENISDSIGFAAALRAHRMHNEYYGMEPRLEGLEEFTDEQLFTLTFANIWCTNASPQHILEMIETDIHSPESARVNGVMMNSQEFSKLWNCKPGTMMNPQEKCEIFS